MGKEWREHDIIRYKVFISCCDRVEKCLTTESQQMRVESREEERVCLYEDDGGRTSTGRGR